MITLPKKPTDPRLDLQDLDELDSLPPEPIFEDVSVRVLTGLQTYRSTVWRLDACLFERCNFGDILFEKLAVWDSRLQGCELSGSRIFKAELLRSQIADCRFTGAQLGEGSVEDVVFSGCKIDMTSLRRCKLTRVVFRDCVLDDADFNEAQLTDVVFDACSLRRTDFSQAQLARVEFASDLSEIRGAASLKGAIISAEQLPVIAPLLCVALGIQVKDA